jgi:hypothetical protein
MSHLTNNRAVYLIGYPYQPDLFSKTTSGLAAMCQRWLEATGKFPDTFARPLVAGVRGTRAEHLARMQSCKKEIHIPTCPDVWDLLDKRLSARTWSDAATVAFFDKLISPAVFVETFAPSAMVKMQLGARPPLAQWWIEGGPAGAHPPVRTYGPVTFALKRRLASHLGVPAGDLITQLVDLHGAEFAHKADQPTAGEFAVRIRFT